MISANTQALLAAAKELETQAASIEQSGRQLEVQLRAQREKQRFLLFFRRPVGDIESLKKQRIRVVEQLRTQGLFLRECAKRLKSIQSRAITRTDKLR